MQETATASPKTDDRPLDEESGRDVAGASSGESRVNGPNGRREVLPSPPERRSRVPWGTVLLGGAAVVVALVLAQRSGLLHFGGTVDPPVVAAPAVPLVPPVQSPAPEVDERIGTASTMAAEARDEARRLTAAIAGVGENVESVRLLTAAVLLDNAARDARPFIGELALAMQAAGDREALLAPLDRLMPWAETGAATRDELARRFGIVADQARMAAARDKPVLESATHFMRDVALWIGIGETPAADVRQTLVRATAFVEGGSLREAVEVLSSLEGLSVQVVGPWVANANARLTIDDSVAQFRREALRRALDQTD